MRRFRLGPISEGMRALILSDFEDNVVRLAGHESLLRPSSILILPAKGQFPHTRGLGHRGGPQPDNTDSARTLSVQGFVAGCRQKGPILRSRSAFLWAIFSLTARGRSTARNQSAPALALAMG